MNRQMRFLHRTMGAVIAVFVLIFSLTGILLNHSSDLELDQEYLTWNWVLAHYGISNIEPDVVYFLDQHVISQFDSRVFIDAIPAINSHKPILGGVVIDDLMLLTTEDELLLFSHDGEFIEKMTESAGIPPLIQNIGLFHGEPVVQTRQGMWRSDFMLEEWEAISLEGIAWSEPQSLPSAVEDELADYFRGKGISVERVILDLHNGRLAGSFSVWIIDILGLMLTFISITGIWLWLKRR